MPKSKSALALVAVLLSFPLSGFGKAAPLKYEVEPIVGYERVQKIFPTAHTRERLFYGARVTAGLPLVSGEAEYTISNEAEDFPSMNLSTKDKTERAKLGIVSSLTLNRLFRFKLRGGAQATRTHSEVTTAGVTTATTSPIEYDPYLGAGVKVMFTEHFSFSTDVTAVFNNFPDDLTDNTYQLTGGFSVRFP